MSPPLRVLLAMADPVTRQLVSGWITSAGFAVVMVSDEDAILGAIDTHRPDAVVVGPEASSLRLHELPVWVPLFQLVSARDTARRSDPRVERVRGADELVISLRRATGLADGSVRGLRRVPTLPPLIPMAPTMPKVDLSMPPGWELEVVDPHARAPEAAKVDDSDELPTPPPTRRR